MIDLVGCGDGPRCEGRERPTTGPDGPDCWSGGTRRTNAVVRVQVALWLASLGDRLIEVCERTPGF
jgi:hypothetical protein